MKQYHRLQLEGVALIIIGLLAYGASCRPPGLTTVGQQYWTAAQIAQRIAELQNATIQANTTGAVADGPAILIVKFTVAAQKTLQTVPEGWQATVTKGWSELKKAVPLEVQSNPIVAAAFGAVDAILGAYAPGGPNG